MGRPPSKRGGDPVSGFLNRPVRLHPAAQIVVASIVLLGGAAFVVIGCMAMWVVSDRPYSHPIGALLLGPGLLGMGSGFLYVGWRLLVVLKRPEATLGPRTRTVCGLLMGIGAIGMAFSAWQSDSVMPAVDALGAGLCSWMILRSAANR